MSRAESRAAVAEECDEEEEEEEEEEEPGALVDVPEAD